MKELGRFEYDNLIIGIFPVKDRPAVLAMGENLKRGALLGRRLFQLGAVTADPGNTGNGTLDGLAIGPGVRAGTYIVECTSGSGPGTIQLVDPDGYTLREFGVGDPYTGPLSMTAQNGSTQFSKGDLFTVVVESGDGRVGLIDPTAFDGRQVPYGVLSEDLDATAAEKPCTVYITGGFNRNKLGIPAGSNIEDFREACESRFIFLEDPISARVPA